MALAQAVGALASGISGIKLAQEAMALPAFSEISLSNLGGGPTSACVVQSTVLQPTQVCSVFVGFVVNGLPLYEYRPLAGARASAA